MQGAHSAFVAMLFFIFSVAWPGRVCLERKFGQTI